MKFLFPNPDQIIAFKDFCVDCNEETEHHAFFEQYHFETHKIMFTHHCSCCYERDPDNTHEFTTVYSVYQWNKFINYEDGVRNN